MRHPRGDRHEDPRVDGVPHRLGQVALGEPGPVGVGAVVRVDVVAQLLADGGELLAEQELFC